MFNVKRYFNIQYVPKTIAISNEESLISKATQSWGMIQTSLVINNLHGLHKVWTQTSGLISFVCHSTQLHIHKKSCRKHITSKRMWHTFNSQCDTNHNNCPCWSLFSRNHVQSLFAGPVTTTTTTTTTNAWSHQTIACKYWKFSVSKEGKHTWFYLYLMQGDVTCSSAVLATALGFKLFTALKPSCTPICCSSVPEVHCDHSSSAPNQEYEDHHVLHTPTPSGKVFFFLFIFLTFLTQQLTSRSKKEVQYEQYVKELLLPIVISQTELQTALDSALSIVYRKRCKCKAWYTHTHTHFMK